MCWARIRSRQHITALSRDVPSPVVSMSSTTMLADIFARALMDSRLEFQYPSD
jgi:hypothetical protein